MEIQTNFECTGDGRRIDVVLAEVSGLTRSRVATLMEEGFCTVDGRPERKAGAKPKAGQQIVLSVPAHCSRKKDSAVHSFFVSLCIVIPDQR